MPPAGPSPRGMQRDVAYPPALIAGGNYWMHTHLPGSFGQENARPTVAYGGYAEVLTAPFWPSNPSGIPRKDRFHKAKLDDEWWYIKSGKPYPWQAAAHTVGSSTMEKKSFRAENLEYNARITYPFDKKDFVEKYIHVQEDETYSKDMEDRYKKLMKPDGGMRNTIWELEKINEPTLKHTGKDKPAWIIGTSPKVPETAKARAKFATRSPRAPKEPRGAQTPRTPRTPRGQPASREKPGNDGDEAMPRHLKTPELGSSVIDPPWATKFNNEKYKPEQVKKPSGPPSARTPRRG
jgi:hypothetical protein